MQGKKKWIFNIVFLLLVIALTLYGLFRGSDLAQLQMLIHQADFRWWLLAFVLVIAFILGESIVLHDIMRTLKAPHHLSHCFLYSFIGFFFSCITPSAGGGQPAQVYFMRKDHIDPAVSVPVLILVTITYKLVLILFALFVFLFRPPAVITALEPVRLWCILGTVLNVLFVGLYVLLVLFPRAVEATLRWCIRCPGRILGASRQQRMLLWLNRWMKQYRDAALCFRSRPCMVLRVTVLTILQRCLLFAVTYLAMRSFGIAAGTLGSIVTLQAMISLGTDLLPLPGGMGASETMFMRIFPALCGETMTLPVLVVSRGISYYGQLIISAIFTVVAVFTIGKREKNDSIL